MGRGNIIGRPNLATANVASGVWTLREQSSAKRNLTWPNPPIPAVTDPFFPYVTMLLTGNGTNGAQNNTFLDSSTNNFTITRNGNTTQGTFSPYGPNWSNYFDGTGDYLQIANNAALGVPTGDFTFETWVFPTSINARYTPIAAWAIDNVGVASDLGYICYITNGKKVNFSVYVGSTTYGVTSAADILTNTWTHVAAVRSGNTLTLYVNGGSVGTTTISGTINTGPSALYRIGGYQESMTWDYFPGYISNQRLVKGTAVYTANFTPPTAPLTAITNTSLLTCQSNRFIDNSSNNFTITRNGDVSVQRFSPFAPSAAYSSSSVIGGSGYFDGTGDYLSVAAATAIDLASSDFTIEMWVFSTAQTNAVDGVFGYGAFTTMLYRNGTTWSWEVGNGSSANYFTINATCTPNTWQHIALTRSGSTFTFWLNGASAGTNTTANAVGTASKNCYIGFNNSGTQYFTGYISNFRLVKGTAVYTTAFTPPTAPLTAITNTSLLLNYTNAGIIDNAMMNDLETVGDAKISTTQSKFGGASISFDGTNSYLLKQTTPWPPLGSGNFTVEFWMYKNASNGTVVGFENASSSTNGFRIWTSSGMGVATNGGNILSNVGSTPTGSWIHVAVVRNSGTIVVYVNGTNVGSAADTTNFSVTRMFVGAAVFTSVSDYLNAYIDDLRVTTGIARYTANFTPPTAALPTQ